MKVALLFYGYFRTFEFCKDSLQTHLLDIIKPDIYINTLDTIFAPPEHELSELAYRNCIAPDPINPLLNWFQPLSVKKIDIRQYDPNFFKDYVEQHNMLHVTPIGQWSWRIISTLHSISYAIQTFKQEIDKQGIHYDMVIITRPDLRYLESFKYNNVELDKINYPAYNICPPDVKHLEHLSWEERKTIAPRKAKGAAACFGFPGEAFNDQMICGSQENIITLGTVASMIPEYYNRGIFLNTETYLGYHCLNNKIPFVGTDFILYELWRIAQREYD